MFSQYDKDGNKKWYNSNYFIFEIILIIIYILWGFNNSFILLLTKKVVYIFSNILHLIYRLKKWKTNNIFNINNFKNVN